MFFQYGLPIGQITYMYCCCTLCKDFKTTMVYLQICFLEKLKHNIIVVFLKCHFCHKQACFLSFDQQLIDTLYYSWQRWFVTKTKNTLKITGKKMFSKIYLWTIEVSAEAICMGRIRDWILGRIRGYPHRGFYLLLIIFVETREGGNKMFKTWPTQIPDYRSGRNRQNSDRCPLEVAFLFSKSWRGIIRIHHILGCENAF